MLLSLSLSECWNEGFTGTERFVIILTIIVLIAAYGIKDEHKILKRVLGTIIVVVLAVGIFSYGGGWWRKRRFACSWSLPDLGRPWCFLLDWIRGNIEGKGDVIFYVVTFVIGIAMSGVFTL